MCLGLRLGRERGHTDIPAAWRALGDIPGAAAPEADVVPPGQEEEDEEDGADPDGDAQGSRRGDGLARDVLERELEAAAAAAGTPGDVLDVLARAPREHDLERLYSKVLANFVTVKLIKEFFF